MGSWANVGAEFVEIFGRKDWRFASDKWHWRDERTGKFYGLRIGLTVVNTLADSLNIPIVGAMGDNWRDLALDKLRSGENEKIVMPEYGATANITAPRK